MSNVNIFLVATRAIKLSDLNENEEEKKNKKNFINKSFYWCDFYYCSFFFLQHFVVVLVVCLRAPSKIMNILID